jgi:hypothetical protein
VASPPEKDTSPSRLPSRRRRAKPRHRLPSGFATIRDLVSFVIGIGIIGNEIFIQASIEPYAVGVGLALTGLPLVFGADERRKTGGEE